MKKAASKCVARKQERSEASQSKGFAGKHRSADAQQETTRLLHELRVHQIELETQNEELRRTQREVEAARKEYQDLYETVPVGCFTLDAQGTVLEANPAGIQLLGESSTALIGRRFALFIEEKNRLGFAGFCKAVLKGTGGKTCELSLPNGGEGSTKVQVFGVPVERHGRAGSAFRLAVMDIAERKRAEEALRRAHEELESRVAERTSELVRSNERLQAEIAERKKAEEALRGSEARFRAFTSATHDVVYCMSQDWTEMRHLQGREFIPDTLEPSSTWLDKYIHVDDQQHVMETIRRAIQSKSVFELEHRVVRVDGSLGWTYSRAIPILDNRGEIVEWFGAASDVTHRKRAEAALQSREREFRLLADNVPAYFSYIDTDLRYRFMNKRYEELFGRPTAKLIGQPVKDVVGEANFRMIEPWLREALADRETSFLYPKVLPNADVRWMSVHYTPDRGAAGPIRGVLALMTDVTDQKRSELALQQNHMLLKEKREELQLLTEKLFMAQDSERQRIARDLHDDFSQRLVAMALDLDDLERKPPLMPEILGKALKPIREELAQLSDDLRNLAHRLHPSLLKHAGLRAALEEHIDQAMKRTGLDITLTVRDVPDSLPLDLATCLFRVFQENLQNVAKHANATEVLVKLSGSPKGIGLSVTDNGTGFNRHDKNCQQKGLGLTSMRERLRLLNGFLNIHSRPVGGTKVCAWIPSQEKIRDASSHPYGG